jgi:hypothetical protein
VHVEAPEPRNVLEHLFAPSCKRQVVALRVAQRQRAVAARVDVPHLDVGLAAADVVLA